MSAFIHPEELCPYSNMNPMNGPSGAPPLWQEARNTDGRVYYYNVQTKATQWAKPVELMTPVEVRIHCALIVLFFHCQIANHSLTQF